MLKKVLQNLKSTRLSFTERTILFIMFSLVAIGIIVSWFDMNWFEEVYVVEDGFIEWLTVLPLAITFFIALHRVFNLAKYRAFIFSMALVFLSLLCVFAIGEEISWGQRIFNIESPDYFKENNTQAETNLHNLVINDTKLNKLIFTQLLSVFVGIFLLGFPWFHSRNEKFRKFVDALAIPVPQLYQVFSIFLLMILVSITPSHKNAELIEFGICALFMLIFFSPANKYIYNKDTLKN